MAAIPPLRKPDTTVGPFREQDSAQLTMVFVDGDDVPIPGSSLTTATLTLYSEDDDEYAIVNSRDHVDILGSIDESGVLTWDLASADMAIFDDELVTERHRALIEWTWGDAQRGSYEIRIVVKNLQKVPA
jgi:hypothetical protein